MVLRVDHTVFLIGMILQIQFSVTDGKRCIASNLHDYGACNDVLFNPNTAWNLTGTCSNNTIHEDDCVMTSICRKKLNLAIFKEQLFSISMKGIILDMLKQCCGSCHRCSIDVLDDHLGYIDPSTINSSDIIFPVIGETSLTDQYGFHFQPIFAVPSSFYCTPKRPNYKILEEVIFACAKMWPFLVICLLFAFISGFMVWVAERNINPGEFAQTFPMGLIDGFWWSFIAMTTVGFGDKVPKSYLGRIYAVIWILAGITICSMFTATITSEIVNARAIIDTDISGKRIGVLKGRVHDIAVVSQHGGIVSISEVENHMLGIDELLDKVADKSIRGFILDKHTFYHLTTGIIQKKYHKILHKMSQLNIMTKEKFHKEDLMCGALIKETKIYKYFKRYFDTSHLYLRTCNSLRLNVENIKIERSEHFLAHKGSFFRAVLYYCLAILGVMICAGFCYEKRHFVFKSLRKEKGHASELSDLNNNGDIDNII